MKELSIEEKAKRYDEAIETARKINIGEGVAAPPNWTVLEVVFPELKESDDERIRKEIISYLKRKVETSPSIPAAIGYWIAWLEKQGEQKTTWSENDEAIYYGVIETEQYMLDVVNGIKKFDVGNILIKEECTRELNWLKFLKDRLQHQPTWKPSNEQMKALEFVIESLDNMFQAIGHIDNVTKPRLKEILITLKKLREE